MNPPENIDAAQITVGVGSFVHPGARITGDDGRRAQRVVIGDHCYIGEGVQIRCPEFILGDYSKIHHQTVIHGYRPCHIGHNAWVGQFCIIDSIGGMTIGDNCGVGAHSQLWSHIKFGDTLEGCRFLSEKAMQIGRDVWFVGHCIVSPIVAADRSMAMVGSVVTKDMVFNTIYAGSPASEISSKIGPQFIDVSLAEKMDRMRAYAKECGVDDKVSIVADSSEIIENGGTCFVVSERTYIKRRTDAEVAFMKFLLPARAKFTPRGDVALR